MSQRLTVLPWCTWYAGEDYAVITGVWLSSQGVSKSLLSHQQLSPLLASLRDVPGQTVNGVGEDLKTLLGRIWRPFNRKNNISGLSSKEQTPTVHVKSKSLGELVRQLFLFSFLFSLQYGSIRPSFKQIQNFNPIIATYSDFFKTFSHNLKPITHSMLTTLSKPLIWRQKWRWRTKTRLFKICLIALIAWHNGVHWMAVSSSVTSSSYLYNYWIKCWWVSSHN